MTGAIVFGATEVRKLCGMDSRKTMKWWRDPARGDARFPEPTGRINGRTEYWHPATVMGWAERTRERRGLVWTPDGLAKPTEEGQ